MLHLVLLPNIKLKANFSCEMKNVIEMDTMQFTTTPSASSKEDDHVLSDIIWPDQFTTDYLCSLPCISSSLQENKAGNPGGYVLQAKECYRGWPVVYLVVKYYHG